MWHNTISNYDNIFFLNVYLVQHLELRGEYVYNTQVISSADTNVKSNHAKNMRRETIHRAKEFVAKHNGAVNIRLARASVLYDDDQAIASEWAKLVKQWRDGKEGESVSFARCFDFSFSFAIFAVGSLLLVDRNLTMRESTKGKSAGAATSTRVASLDELLRLIKELLRKRGPSDVHGIAGFVCNIKKGAYKPLWLDLLTKLKTRNIGEFFLFLFCVIAV